jgi:hypothetical protein
LPVRRRSSSGRVVDVSVEVDLVARELHAPP